MNELIERLAEKLHEQWSSGDVIAGVGRLSTVPYAELREGEKARFRGQAEQIVSLFRDSMVRFTANERNVLAYGATYAMGQRYFSEEGRRSIRLFCQLAGIETRA
jgi:hypothetical protein